MLCYTAVEVLVFVHLFVLNTFAHTDPQMNSRCETIVELDGHVWQKTPINQRLPMAATDLDLALM